MNAIALDTRSAWRAPSRIGYDASAERTAARVLPMLAEERVVWLSTVRPDGRPHLCPTWFWWDGEALVVFSKPEAVKARNLRANRRVMVALGDPDDDFAVGLIEAEAAFDDGASAAGVPDAFFAKYASALRARSLDPATFRELYTEVIRIVPTRYLAWNGQSAAAPDRRVPPRPFAQLVDAIGRPIEELRRVAGALGGPSRVRALAA